MKNDLKGISELFNFIRRKLLSHLVSVQPLQLSTPDLNCFIHYNLKGQLEELSQDKYLFRKIFSRREPPLGDHQVEELFFGYQATPFRGLVHHLLDF